MTDLDPQTKALLALVLTNVKRCHTLTNKASISRGRYEMALRTDNQQVAAKIEVEYRSLVAAHTQLYDVNLELAALLGVELPKEDAE